MFRGDLLKHLNALKLSPYKIILVGRISYKTIKVIEEVRMYIIITQTWRKKNNSNV